jgi:ribosomal protein S12 methylthiotransferase accessory factor
MVVRPNARSLSVSQGKGIDLDAATASGVMESIELWHAERPAIELRLGSYEDLRWSLPIVDVAALPRSETSRWQPDLRILWAEGVDIVTRSPAWVPYELVHTDYTLPLPTGSGCFPMTSNGLASGNVPAEAIGHALCELIERDGATLWYHRTAAARADTRVDLASVDHAACRSVIARFEGAGVDIIVWDTTSDVGVPSFMCVISDDDLHGALGAGCHPDRAIALLRALTEAAQSRLTYVSGARDDMYRRAYARYANADAREHHKALLADPPVRSFGSVPTFEGRTLDADVDWLVAQLRQAGLDQVVVVDLTRPDIRIPVVRAIVPGLEGPEDHIPGYVPGPRARSMADPPTP